MASTLCFSMVSIFFNDKSAFNFTLIKDNWGTETTWDLKNSALRAKEKNKTNGNECKVPNHEYLTGGFSSMYMSRNRVRSWEQQSFTIQAGGRHAPIHPQAPKMKFIEKDKRIFVPGSEHLYRRLSVRECARIQTFPDEFIFEGKYGSAGHQRAFFVKEL